MAALDFYFDYRSPYAYLAQTQVRKLGVEVAWRPFEILQLMDKVGNVPTSITCKPKGKYLGADLMRWVALYKVPFQRHPQSGSIDASRTSQNNEPRRSTDALPPRSFVRARVPGYVVVTSVRATRSALRTRQDSGSAWMILRSRLGIPPTVQSAAYSPAFAVI